jgi:hypothetical protein
MRQNTSVLAASLLLSLTALNAEASLTAYNAAGNTPVVYSSVSNLTWTGDANLFQTQANSYADGASAYVTAVIGSVTDSKIYDAPNFYDTPSDSGYHTLSASDFDTMTGIVSWFGAQAFTTYLNSINYASSNQWTLPTSNAVSGYDNGSQLGELFYKELGGTAGSSIPSGQFSNVQSYVYWSGTEYAANPSVAWLFLTDGGSQGLNYKDGQFFAWAVSPGQVSAVPVPAAVWLFGSGLMV